MRLPWSNQEEEELKQKLESLKEEKERLENRFKAEKKRRSELSRKKQEAEEKINRLEDRIHGIQADEEEDDVEEPGNLEEIDFESAYRLLQKLETVESPEEDMVTVFSPKEVHEVEDLKGLKNTANRQQIELLQRHESFVAFLDPDVFELVLKTRPFFDANWELSNGFSTRTLLSFIESKKTWALVSAGETRIFTEKSGEYSEVETLKSRVDRKHSKGGFSQDRFERKREEQVQQHLEQVEEALKERENIYLLGQKDLCKQLPGKHLGGFDPNKSGPEVFYGFRMVGRR